jgi:hypothetical protein
MLLVGRQVNHANCLSGRRIPRPCTPADFRKYYVQSSVNVLDDALEWLRGEYGLANLEVFKERKGKMAKGEAMTCVTDGW